MKGRITKNVYSRYVMYEHTMLNGIYSSALWTGSHWTVYVCIYLCVLCII